MAALEVDTENVAVVGIAWFDTAVEIPAEPVLVADRAFDNVATLAEFARADVRFEAKTCLTDLGIDQPLIADAQAAM